MRTFVIDIKAFEYKNDFQFDCALQFTNSPDDNESIAEKHRIKRNFYTKMFYLFIINYHQTSVVGSQN